MTSTAPSRSLRRFRPMTAPYSRRPEPQLRNWHPLTGSTGAADFNDRVLGDGALVRRVEQGDEEAARVLVERLTPCVLKAVRRRMPRWASEEDLVQTVFAKVFSKLHQYSGIVPLECWVARIALNTSLNQIAYESVRPEWRMCDLNAEQERSLENWTEPEGEVDEQREARELVELMLAQLKPEERQIITLLHIEQRSTKEISLMTGLSIALIKVKAFRTRRKMQRFGRRLVK